MTASILCYIQAIVALKKGAHLLKCGKRGKPKFCAFRLSSVSNFSALCFYQIKKQKTKKEYLRYADTTSLIMILFFFLIHDSLSVMGK